MICVGKRYRDHDVMQWLLLGLLFVGGAVLFSVVGVVATRRYTRRIVAEGHNDVMVPLFLTAGVIYAVLLAFMVIAMWESYDAAKANTAEEASLLVPMYRQSMIMSPEKGREMRKLIREYAEGVVSGWERFRETAQGSENARLTVDRMIYVFGTLKPESKAEEIMDVQFLQTFSQLMTDRNKRLLHASESLSWVMWLAVAGGGMITVGMSFVLFMDRAIPHVVMTSVLSGLVGLLLLLMAVLNRPFVGPLGIQPEPFESSLRLFIQIDEDFKKIRGEQK
jgi:multisubunit Na+/H+ antiporter MnhC subunit